MIARDTGFCVCTGDMSGEIHQHQTPNARIIPKPRRYNGNLISISKPNPSQLGFLIGV